MQLKFSADGWDRFATALVCLGDSAPQSYLEPINFVELSSEVGLCCLLALGSAPSAAAIEDAIKGFDVVVNEPSKFLALTIARSPIMDKLLGNVLARRLRFALHGTWRGWSDMPAPGPAPGEAPWELVEEMLASKEKARLGRGFGADHSLRQLHHGKETGLRSTEDRGLY